MRSTALRRMGSLALATGLLTMGTMLATAPAQAAPGDTLKIGNTMAAYDSTGVWTYTTPAPCSTGTTRHVVYITNVVATNPADQAAADKWLGTTYAPSSLNLPGPLVNYPASQNIGALASIRGTTFVPGVYTQELRCQNNLGTTVYDRFTGTVRVAANGTWTADALALPATTTTLSATPTAITAGDPVVLTATVAHATGSTAPTGNVEFFNGATSLGTAPVNASGIATLTTTFAANASVVAKYAGDTNYGPSDSAPTAITVTPRPAADTTATLAVDITSGPSNQAVTLTGTIANVTTPATIPTGTCAFKDLGILLGTAPVSAAGTCAITNSSFAGPGHSFTVTYTPTDAALFKPATSAPVTASYAGVATVPDEQTVIVTIPTGTLTIFTPYTPANPLNLGTASLSADGKSFSASALFDGVTITDTRAGNPGWAASLARADFVNATGDTIAAKLSGFENVAPRYTAGNAIQSITVNDLPADSASFIAGPMSFAKAAPGAGTGTVDVTANFVLKNVPTSTKAGLYTTTVTFTVN